jgi:hypothetical protein
MPHLFSPYSFRARSTAVYTMILVMAIIASSAFAEPAQVDSLNWCGTQKKFELELLEQGMSASAAAAAGCTTYGSCDIPSIRDGWAPDENTPIVHIRLAIHTLANSDGSSPFTTEAAAQNAVNFLNQHYLPARIQFDFIFDQVNNTDWRLLGEEEVDALKQFSAVDPAHWLNVWVGNVEFGYSFGTFPYSANALQATGGIVLGHFHWGGNFSTFAHEVGHCLGLWHTFHGVSEVASCGSCYESVNTSDRDVVGDYCSDTPPTPVWYNCSDATGVDSCAGLSWGNTQRENYMGYTPGSCRSLFTLQQRARMQCWIDDALSGWVSGVLIQGDTVFGKAPLPVEIDALTFRQVNSWAWDLGDQTTLTTPSASHTYEEPGMYTVGVEIGTSDGGYSDTRPNLVWVHDDTVTVSSVSGSRGTPIIVPVNFSNHVPLSEVILPIIWSSENGLVLDSISTVGFRGEGFDTKNLLDIDNANRRAVVQLTPSLSGETPLAPGHGPVLAFCFTAASDVSDTTALTISGYGSYEPYFACPIAVYPPTLRAGVVHPATCCVGRVGDANFDGEDEPTIGDVSVLIDMLFLSGVPVPCLAEGDVNRSGGLEPTPSDISIGDVSILVDYLFITGSTLGLPDCL